MASTTSAPDAARAPVGFTGLLYGVFTFWLLFFLTDPSNVNFGYIRIPRDFGVLKYFPLMLFGVGALFFTLAGLGIFQLARLRQLVAEIGGAWPIWLLALFMLGGSIYLRRSQGIEETFIPSALAMASFFVAFAHIRFHPAPLCSIRRLFYALLLAAAYMGGWIAYKRFDTGHAFHVEIFLIVPLAIYFFQAIENRKLAWLLLVALLAVGVLSNKNTGYLVTLYTVGHIGVVSYFRSKRGYRDAMARLFLHYLLLLLALAAVATLAYLLYYRETYLPSGSVEYRASTYLMAWQKFLASPAWGSLYSETPIIEFTLYYIGLANNKLPTHSDILDMLAHGGVLGFSLFLLALAFPIRAGFKALRQVPTMHDAVARATIHGLMGVVVAGIICMAFNPLLLNHIMASLFWLIQGLLYAVAQRILAGI
jgi:O-antigen ligase